MADETVWLFAAGGVLVDWQGTPELMELTGGRLGALLPPPTDRNPR